jgi:predicted secreted Zn-dependent protease
VSITPSNPELAWRKSTRSTSGACVEVAPLPGGGIAVRDSKDPSGPVLRYTAKEWTAFLQGVEGGEFSNLTWS